MTAAPPRAGRGPSPTLPLRFLIVAAVAFLGAALALPGLAGALAGHYYQPRLLALTHAVTLGWIMLSIMGASYQLVPIVLECRIWSERLARWQWALLVAGIVGMVAHFWVGHWNGLAWAAGLVALGVVAHLVNVGLSLRALPRWTFSARLFVLALAGLGLTVLFGLTLAANRLWAFWPGDVFARLAAHLHLALLGWIAPMMLGVAARVYPMFLLAPPPPRSSERLQLWGLALGVPALVIGLLAAPPLVVPGVAGVAGALAAHALSVVSMVRARKRPTLDSGLRFAATGTACLAPAGALGIGLACGVVAGPHVVLAYAVLALGGWISLTIVGMMLKIVPFLVWYRVYGARVGREPVPTLAQLSWPRAERLAYGLLTAGVIGLAGAVGAGASHWIAVAGIAVAAGAAAFTAALVRILLHLLPGTARRPAGATVGVQTR